SLSARSLELACVSTFPTRNERYSSLSVGARNERYPDTITDTFSFSLCRSDTRGLNAVSIRSGNLVTVTGVAAGSGRDEDNASKFRQRSPRTPSVNRSEEHT